MKKGTKQFLINLAICVISLLIIILFKLIYYGGLNVKIVANGDVAFLMASMVGSTLAWRLTEQSQNERSQNDKYANLKIALIVVSIVVCALGVIIYGVGILYSGNSISLDCIEFTDGTYNFNGDVSIYYIEENVALFYATGVISCLCLLDSIIEGLLALRLSNKTLKSNFGYN